MRKLCLKLLDAHQFFSLVDALMCFIRMEVTEVDFVLFCMTRTVKICIIEAQLMTHSVAVFVKC